MTTDHKQNNSAVHYQLVTGLDTDAPYRYAVRDTWEEAADDAVNSGWAEWKSKHELTLERFARIDRIR